MVTITRNVPIATVCDWHCGKRYLLKVLLLLGNDFTGGQMDINPVVWGKRMVGETCKISVDEMFTQSMLWPKL